MTQMITEFQLDEIAQRKGAKYELTSGKQNHEVEIELGATGGCYCTVATDLPDSMHIAKSALRGMLLALPDAPKEKSTKGKK